MHDVFISYSSVNQYMADAICHRMESGGLKCWYAPRNIAGGEDWPAAIMNAIHQARVFVLIYSANSNSSKQVIREVAAAVESECIIVPFRIDDTPMCANLTYYLSGVHWMDAMNISMEKAIETLYTRVWWLIHPPQTPQQPPQWQPQRPMPPVQQPAPAKKKKSKTWLIVLICLTVMSVVGIIAEAAARNLVYVQNPGDMGINTPTGSNQATPVWNGTQTMYFENLSQQGDYRYPFFWSDMISDSMDTYFVEDVQRGSVSCLKTDTVVPVIQDFLELPEDPYWLTVLTANHMDKIYFLYEITGEIICYDKSDGVWIWDDRSVYLEWSDTEWYIALLDQSYINTGDTFDDAVWFLFYDEDPSAQCYTRIVKLYPDGTLENRDIRHLKLTGFISGIDRTDCHVVAMLDHRNNVRILDLTTLELLDISNETMLRDYLPYNTGDRDVISETGRYLCQVTGPDGADHLQVWDLETQRPACEDTFTGNFTTCFVGKDRLLVYNAENCSVEMYDLEKGTKMQILEKQYFVGNEAYSQLPFFCRYVQELDACLFVNLQATENGDEGAVVTLTDLNGNILAQSQVLEVPFDLFSVDAVVKNGMIFFLVTSQSTLYGESLEYTDAGILAVIYRAKFTYNAKGELIFTP